MRMILLAGMMSVTAATAQAGSIDLVKSDTTTRSIDFVVCESCNAIKAKKVVAAEITLKPGTQKIVVRTANGVLKVFRTEAWLGGSPVTYVSNASPDQIDKQSAEVVPAEDQKIGPIVIDKDATTSAVTADMSGNPAAVEQPKQVRALNPEDMQLRLK